MSNTTIFIIIAVILLGIGLWILAWKLLKKTFKWAAIILIIIFVVSTVFGVNIIQDARNFQDKFPSSKNTFLLEDNNNQLQAGFKGKIQSFRKTIEYVNEKELNNLQNDYEEVIQSNNKTSLKNFKNDSFKVLVFKESAFKNMGEVELSNQRLTSNKLLQMIKADDTEREMVEYVIKNKNLSNNEETRSYVQENLRNQLEVNSSQEMKGVLFSQLVGKATQDKKFLIKQLKTDNITVYPETTTFKIVDYIPLSLINQITRG